MTTLNPKAKPAPWRHATCKQRVETCRIMLAVHEFLTVAEARRVKQRIIKWSSPERQG